MEYTKITYGALQVVQFILNQEETEGNRDIKEWGGVS